MSIDTVNYSQTEKELAEAICWLETLGINPNRGRFGIYQKSLKKLFGSYEERGNKGDFPAEVNAIYEVFDLIDIHKGLNGYSSKELPDLANFYQKGVNCYSDENLNNSGNKPRNTAFELLVASKLNKSGINIHLSQQSDVEGTFENNRMLIECKRLHSFKKIKANIEDAAQQLNKKLRHPKYSRSFGVIALDFTKLINPDFDLLVKENDKSVMASLDQATNLFIRDYQSLWQGELGRNIIGIKTYFSLMSVIENRNLLTHCKQYAFCVSPKASPRWHEVAWRLAKQLGSTSKEVIIA